MLHGTAFTLGRARYAEGPAGTAPTGNKVFVEILPAGLDAPVLAQIDTGAAWTILDPEIADVIGVLGGRGEAVTLDTRLGRRRGRLERVSITLLADEGQSLQIDATILACDDWPGGNFIGFGGFLERLRFAIDPGPEQSFFFGPCP